ncbi:MAG TPA: hypothetical protein VK698_23155 [Kofleriaceae bacterium]|nr:hypothetical protein [Kofleriaceae bacterium]
MFDDLADHRGAGRWRAPGAALSIAVHVAALAGFYIAAVWRVGKLEIEATPLFIAVPLSAAHLEEGEKPSRPAAGHKGPTPRRARELTQVRRDAAPLAGRGDPVPDRVPDAAPKAEVALISDGLELASRCGAGPGCLSALFVDLPDAVCGDRRIEAREECDDGNRMDRDGCSAECAIEKRTVVDNRIIEGYRIAGDPQIHPSEDVRQMMVLNKQSRILGAVKMCIWRDGSVLSLQLLRSTGYREYDQLLLSRMRGWHYRPYALADGTAVTACTAVVFVYTLDIRKQRVMLR